MRTSYEMLMQSPGVIVTYSCPRHIFQVFVQTTLYLLFCNVCNELSRAESLVLVYDLYRRCNEKHVSCFITLVFFRTQFLIKKNSFRFAWHTSTYSFWSLLISTEIPYKSFSLKILQKKWSDFSLISIQNETLLHATNLTFGTILAFLYYFGFLYHFGFLDPFWILFREQQCEMEAIGYNSRIRLKLGEVQKDLRRSPPEVRVTIERELCT